MTSALRRTYPLCKKEAILRQVKLKHYITAIKVECFYVS